MTELHIAKIPPPPTLALPVSEIARQLGGDGDVSVDGWARSPCPAHGGDGLNLSIKLDESDRLVVTCWSHRCSPNSILRAIDERLGTKFGRPNAAEEFADNLTDNSVSLSTPETWTVDPDAEFALWRAEEAGYGSMLRALAAERCFAASKPIQPGDLADRYLRQRGSVLEKYPAALRLHGGLWHRESGQRWPAIVAMVASCTGRFSTVHRTYPTR